jgi:hypothetical protein
VTAAGHCENHCNLRAGGVCATVNSDGAYVVDQIVPTGVPFEVHAGRQRGTCGGLEPFAPDAIAVTVEGPDAAALSSDSAEGVRFTPRAPGEYRVTVRARGDGAAVDRRIVVAAGARFATKLQVAPPPDSGTGDAELTVRFVPRAGDAGGFGPHGWPVVFRGVAPTAAPQQLQLPPGAYQLEWRRGAHVAVARVAVEAADSLAVRLPAAAVEIRPAAAAGHEPIAIRAATADHALWFACLTQPVVLHAAPGAIALDGFAGEGVCNAPEPEAAPTYRETRALRPGTRAMVRWP